MIVSDNGTGLTNMATCLRWSRLTRIEWCCIAPGKPQRNGFEEGFNERHLIMPENCLPMTYNITRPHSGVGNLPLSTHASPTASDTQRDGTLRCVEASRRSLCITEPHKLKNDQESHLVAFD